MKTHFKHLTSLFSIILLSILIIFGCSGKKVTRNTVDQNSYGSTTYLEIVNELSNSDTLILQVFDNVQRNLRSDSEYFEPRSDRQRHNYGSVFDSLVDIYYGSISDENKFGSEIIKSNSTYRIFWYPSSRDSIIDSIINNLKNNKDIQYPNKIIAYEMNEGKGIE